MKRLCKVVLPALLRSPLVALLLRAMTDLGADNHGFSVIDLSGEESVRQDVGLGKKSHRCVDCGSRSPEAETNFTLISARYGWRLHREKDPKSGERAFEWRCPTCWNRFKLARFDPTSLRAPNE